MAAREGRAAREPHGPERQPRVQLGEPRRHEPEPRKALLAARATARHGRVLRHERGGPRRASRDEHLLRAHRLHGPVSGRPHGPARRRRTGHARHPRREGHRAGGALHPRGAHLPLARQVRPLLERRLLLPHVRDGARREHRRRRRGLVHRRGRHGRLRGADRQGPLRHQGGGARDHPARRGPGLRPPDHQHRRRGEDLRHLQLPEVRVLRPAHLAAVQHPQLQPLRLRGERRPRQLRGMRPVRGELPRRRREARPAALHQPRCDRVPAPRAARRS